jgi:hypothetical protein
MIKMSRNWIVIDQNNQPRVYPNSSDALNHNWATGESRNIMTEEYYRTAYKEINKKQKESFYLG